MQASGNDFDLLFHDDCMLVAAKPSGLLSVPGRGSEKQDCLALRVAAFAPDALVVHRLDMATSGLIVFARGKSAQQRLSAAFAERRVHKRYVAVVSGALTATRGEIDLPLITDWPNRPMQKVDLETGKASLTRYEVTGRDPSAGTTRVALEPVTGRTHQLRVHLWALGHPILGDALYAPPEVRERAPRLLLHAESLRLPHPANDEPMVFHQPPPF